MVGFSLLRSPSWWLRSFIAAAGLSLWAAGHAGCLVVVSFDDYGASTVSGSAGQDVGAGGQGGVAAGAGGAGAGGAGGDGGATCDANLLIDPANCGACDWDCAGGLCSQGVCQPTSLELPDASSLTVLGEDVFVIVGFSCDGDGMDDVTIQVFPALFDAGSAPTASIPTLDSCALDWAVGPQRAYYPPQDGLGVLEACTNSTCTRIDYDLFGNHINGAALTDEGGMLYVIGNKTTSELRRANVGANGLPEPTTTLLATTIDTSFGGQFVVFDPTTQSVWWTTVGAGGCVYREAFASLDGGQRTCFAMSPADFAPAVSTNRVALAIGGGLFALTNDGAGGPGALYRIDDAGNATLFGPGEAAHPLKSDGDQVYVGYSGGGFNVLDAVTGEILAGIFVPYGVKDLDAHHPDFVFFTGDGKLHRWRKLPPR